MIKFIIAETNNRIAAQIRAVIMNVMKSYSFSFELVFIHYFSELRSYIFDHSEKIYLLDMVIDSEEGIEWLEQIREVDLSSFVLLIGSRLETDYFKRGLLIFDYVSLFNHYQKQLSLDLNYILRFLLKNQSLHIRMNRVDYCILFRDILYIATELSSRKTVIVTKDRHYFCYLRLYQIESKLSNRFVRAHRSCIVNLDQIVRIDSSDNLIFLEGGEFIFASRRYIKNVLEKFLDS